MPQTVRPPVLYPNLSDPSYISQSKAIHAAISRDVQLAALDPSRTLGGVSRQQTYELAHGALERQLAEANASHAHWNKVREFNADLVYEQAVAAAGNAIRIPASGLLSDGVRVPAEISCLGWPAAQP